MVVDVFLMVKFAHAGMEEEKPAIQAKAG